MVNYLLFIEEYFEKKLNEKKIKLGVNIDHIATLEMQEMKIFQISLVKAVKILHKINVDSITIHLREDRRHIKDKDVEDLKKITFFL